MRCQLDEPLDALTEPTSGLLVSRMLGLRNPEQFTAAARPGDAAPWVGGVFTDAGGTRWMELDLPALVREQRFLEVGA